MMVRPIVLTISAGKTTRRRIWSGEKPIVIGTARRWKLERTDGGVRLQNGQERSYGFEHAQLESGAKLELEGVVIQLKTTVQLPPAYRSEAGVAAASGKMRVYHQARGWTLESADLGSTYTAHVDGETVFRLDRSGAEYLLTAYATETLRLSTPKSVHELGFGQALILAPEELRQVVLRSGIYEWTFNCPEDIAVIDGKSAGNFWAAARKDVAGPITLAAAFLFASILWPESQDTALDFQVVQVPQITLSKPMKPAPMKPAAMGSGATVAKNTPVKKAAPSAAAAFQGDKLQSAMKGLFRGGMTQLLAKSEYGPGSDRSDSARKLFNSNSPALHSTAPVTGPGIGNGTRVAALGGDGQGSGKGVGYGHGEHANVVGQGRSYVAMDTTGSSVEEGLTKDEVGKVIHRHMSEVRYCYEASILRYPDLEGKLVLGFTIGASGKVKIAGVRSSTLTDSKLDDCVVRRLSAWKFPSTKGGIDVGVTYPFIFKTIGG